MQFLLGGYLPHMDDASVPLCGTRFLMHTLRLLPRGDEFRMNFEAVERLGGIFLGDPNQVHRAGPMGLYRSLMVGQFKIEEGHTGTKLGVLVVQPS
jgi:hypothetical protein